MADDRTILRISTYYGNSTYFFLTAFYFIPARVGHVRFFGAWMQPHRDNALSLSAHTLVYYMASIPM